MLRRETLCVVVLLAVFCNSCKQFERTCFLKTEPIKEINDTTILFSAHLIDYNPQNPVKRLGFAIALNDSTKIETNPIEIFTSHPDSVHQEFFKKILSSPKLKTRGALVFRPIRIYVKSFAQLKNGEKKWGEMQSYLKNLGTTTKITKSPTSITFEYEISKDVDCLYLMSSTFSKVEYGFFCGREPYPTENTYLSKISEFIDDDELMSCLFDEPKIVKTYTFSNLERNTTYYFQFFLKIYKNQPPHEIFYGERFAITTEP
jgi:hypothetical protein